MPRIYFIIVTYNAMKWAEKCFSSLRASRIPVQCIVVDNGSVDGTQDYIRNNFPEIHFIQSDINLGFGKANNIGIEHAYKNGADFFYLMNQDAWIYPDSVEKLLRIYNQHPNKNDIGILSPMHLDGTEKKLDIFLDKYIATNFENSRMISDFYFGTPKDYYEISFINAAHWLIPKQTIEKVGGFNPYFFHYGEDNEYVNRLHYHNLKILLIPSSKVVHDGKQVLSKVDYSVFKDLSIETKILNPNFKNQYNLEVRSLKKSILKNLVGLNTNAAKNLFSKLKKIQSEKNNFDEINRKIILEKNVFLNL